MKKKILILIMAALLAVSIPVFAEETTSTANPGITPDSPLYILDKLAEKIQMALITDAVKEAEALAGLAQERLAESKAMVEVKNVEKATAAINEYKELMDKAIDVIDEAAKDGKTVTKTIDMIAERNITDEAVIEKLMELVPAEYKAELEKAIDALPEETKAVTEDNKEKEDQVEKVSAASAVLTGKIQDKALLEKITKAGLNNRQIAALVSLSEQSEKDLSDVVDLFLTNSKGIGKTIMELNLAPKVAMKDINKTFKELKKEIKSGFAVSDDDKTAEVKDAAAVVDENEDEDNDDSSMDKKDAEKLEKKLEKAAEKLEKKIEHTEKKYEKKYAEKSDNDDKDDKED